ncbi:TSUP family transporter [Brevundimonas sp.]|uniref:TSUP family transporter n=1 Tax=Brevundimonas sp. TaxID=1871086 RepID=UPI00289F94FC|nr:TSUP family transporter [Brevundimonas sp.]
MLELAPDVLAFLFVVAVAAGFIDAIAGGGGLITVPALLAVGVPPVTAIATNKVQGSFGTAAATWTFWRKGRIDFALLKWPLLATVAGAILGAVAVTFVDTDWLLVLLPALLIGIAVYFLVGPKASDEDVHARLTPLAFGAVAGGIGFYDGFFGPGAGSFFALALVTLLGMGLTRATAHTKALNFASNIVSVVVFAVGGHVLWAAGLIMATGQVLGGWLGSHAAMRFGPRLIRPLLVVICLGMVVKLLSDPANPIHHWVASRL